MLTKVEAFRRLIEKTNIFLKSRNLIDYLIHLYFYFNLILLARGFPFLVSITSFIIIDLKVNFITSLLSGYAF